MLTPLLTPLLTSLLATGFMPVEGYRGPSLRLDFAANDYRMGAVGTAPAAKTYSDLITFTRASGGGITNAAGQFEWVGNNVPRITYDPVTLKRLGQLIEEQRTNLIRYSADFTNAAWSKGSGVSISTDGQLAPDGTPMPLITLAGTTNHNINQTLLAPLATGQAHTISVYVRPKSAPFPFQIAYYDGSTSLNATLITPIAGETQRIDFTFTPTVVAASPQIRILGFGNGGAGAQVYIWGAQPELGSAPSSYIPTTTAQVTRAADVATVNTLSPWYNPLEGTLVVKLSAYSGQTGFRNVVTMHAGAATQLYVSMETMGITVSGVTSAAPINTSRPVPLGIAGSYKVGEPVRASKNGSSALVAVNNVAAALPFTQMAIGRSTFYGGDLFSGVITSITYYPRVIDVQQASA